MNDEELKLRAELTDAVDQAIGLKKKLTRLEEEKQAAGGELKAALDSVGATLETLDHRLMSIARAGYWLGYVELEDGQWDFIIKPEIPPDHLDLNDG